MPNNRNTSAFAKTIPSHHLHEQLLTVLNIKLSILQPYRSYERELNLYINKYKNSVIGTNIPKT